MAELDTDVIFPPPVKRMPVRRVDVSRVPARYPLPAGAGVCDLCDRTVDDRWRRRYEDVELLLCDRCHGDVSS